MPRRALCFFLSLCFLLSFCTSALASDTEDSDNSGSGTGWTAVPIYLDGLLLARGYGGGGTVYIPVGPICRYADISVSWEGDSERFTLHLDDLCCSGKCGQQYYYADGRYIYAPEDWLVHLGELYLPLNALCKLLNIQSRYIDSALHLEFSIMQILQGGENYYELNYSMEDIYWLSHIITSEAGIEPLAGKIGVGNVVLNRVQDPDFPNTVFGVVYDYKHTVQFEPVSKGTIHQEPKEEDMIAAYLVLEGANTAGSCLYFVNPDFGSYWFDNNLTLVTQIGRHNFYISKDGT